MKTHTQTATVREMRTLANTCQKHATDAAESSKNCHTLAASVHSAANRATMDAIAAENAALRARNASRATIITLLATTAVNIGIATAIICFL
jgi:hypothetical protein